MSTANALHFHCPACGRPTSAHLSAVGQTSRCTACGGWIVVPGSARSPAAAIDLPDDDAPPVVLLPAAPTSTSSIGPSNSQAAGAPAVSANQLPAAAPKATGPLIDLSRIPGLSTRSAVYQEKRTTKTYGVAHKPGTTFGHFFGGSFGCVFGFYMALLASTIVIAIVAAIINHLSDK